jgi:hypothetical protein
MKRRKMTTLVPLAAVAALTLIATALPVAHAEDRAATCSVSMLKGTYSVQGQGTIVAQLPNFPAPPFPFAEVAIDYLDGAGNISGKFTANVDGVVVPGTVAGTYTVNADCTGTVTMQTNSGIPVNESFVALGNRSLRLVDTDFYIVITRTMERIGD